MENKIGKEEWERYFKNLLGVNEETRKEENKGKETQEEKTKEAEAKKRNVCGQEKSWKILEEKGITDSLIKKFKIGYEETRCTLRTREGLTEEFEALRRTKM